MTNPGGKVVRKITALTNDEAKELVAKGLLRAVSRAGRRGKETVALAADCSPRTVEKAMALDTLPAGHTLFNLLLADASALDELAAHYGFRLVPVDDEAAEFSDLHADTAELSAEMARALADGHVDHQERGRIVNKGRIVARKLTAIIAQSDRKGAA